MIETSCIKESLIEVKLKRYNWYQQPPTCESVSHCLFNMQIVLTSWKPAFGSPSKNIYMHRLSISISVSHIPQDTLEHVCTSLILVTSNLYTLTFALLVVQTPLQEWYLLRRRIIVMDLTWIPQLQRKTIESDTVHILYPNIRVLYIFIWCSLVNWSWEIMVHWFWIQPWCFNLVLSTNLWYYGNFIDEWWLITLGLHKLICCVFQW